MTIEVQIAGGTIVEFPDGTDEATMKKALSTLTPTGTPKLQPSADGVSFLQSVKAGFSQLGATGEALKAGVAHVTGNVEAEAAAIQQYDTNKAKVAGMLEGATDWREIVDADSFGEGFIRTLDMIKEQFGLNSPQMATIMAGGAGGAALAPYLPHPIATAVSKVGGFGVGAFLASYPVATGFNLGRQIDEGQELNVGKAALLGIPSALADAVVGGVFAKTGIGKIGTSLFGEGASTIVGRVGQKLGEALAVGVPAEVLQEALEREAANLDLTSEEARRNYLDAAIYGAAGLTPMGLMGAIPSNPRLPNKVERKSEEVQQMLKEKVETATEPSQNIIRTPDEATQILTQMGVNPDVYSDPVKVKAANLFIQDIDQNRMKFIENGIPKGSSLSAVLQQGQIAKSKSPLKVLKDSKMVVPSAVIESLNSNVESDIASLADQLLPLSTALDTQKVPKIDLEASTEVLVEQGRSSTQGREKLFHGPEIPQKPLTEILKRDVDQLKAQTRDIFKLRAGPFREYAIGVLDIPEKTLKDTQGRWLPKSSKNPDARTIEKAVTEEHIKRLAPVEAEAQVNEEVIKQTPPQRSPKEIVDANLWDSVAKNINETLVTKEDFKIPKKLDSLLRTVDRVTKGLVESKLSKDFLVDQESGKFKKPLRVAQGANLLFTATNFSNVQGYPNLDIHLQETWEYLFDRLPKKTTEALLESTPDLLKAMDDDGFLGTQTVDYWSQTNEGRRELLSFAFSEYAEGIRSGEPLKGIPVDTRKVFSKTINTLENIKKSSKGLGMNTFEDMFPLVGIEGKTPREVAFDSIDALKNERNRQLSDAMRVNHWDNLNSVEATKQLKQAIQDTKAGNTLRGFFDYATSRWSSMKFAANHPLIARVFNLRLMQDDFQNKLLLEAHKSMETWMNEPSKEIRMRTVDVVKHLQNTDQRLQRDPSGGITFTRDGQVVTISHPEMVSLIESVVNGGVSVLNRAESETRLILNKTIPQAFTMPIKEIESTINQIEKDGSLTKDQIATARESLSIIQNIQTLKGKPFVPSLRFGDYGFSVHLAKNIGKDEKVKKDSVAEYHSQVEKGRFRKKYDQEGYKRVQEELEEYRNNPDYVIFEGFEMTYQNIYDKLSQDSLTLDLVAGLLGSENSEFFSSVKEQIDSKIQYGGFKKKFSHSENIKGYSEDWDRVYSSYLNGSAHFFSQSRYGGEIEQTRSDINQALNKNLHKKVLKKINDFVDYTNTPFDSFQVIRQINYIWTMGMNPSTAALQVMTLPTSTITSMTRFSPNVVKNAALITKYTKIAYKVMSKREYSDMKDGVLVFRFDNKNLLRDLVEKEGLSQDQVRYLKRIYSMGKLGATPLEEAAGRKNFETRTQTGKYKELASKATHFSGVLMSTMEQLTRFATTMAHYDLLINNSNAVQRGLSFFEGDHRFIAKRTLGRNTLVDDMVDTALDDAHALFGKTGRADIFRGAGGAFLFPFQTYPQQIVEFYFNLFGRGKEGKQAAVVAFGTLFFFAGLIGLPGGELLKELLEEAYKAAAKEEIDFEASLRLKLAETFGNDTVGKFITQGVFRAGGTIDAHRRIGLPIFPAQDLILAAMGVRGDITELGGVQGSIATNIVNAFHAYGNDESTMKVASLLTPVAASNLLKASVYYDEGVTTQKGKRLVSRDVIRANPIELLMRGLGVTTDRVASGREVQYWGQVLDRQHRPKINSLRSRAKNYATKMTQAMKDKNSKQENIYRKKYQGVIRDLVKFMKENNVSYDVKAFNRSVFDAVDQRMVGGLRYKDLSKNIRHKKELIELAAGVKD